MPNNVQKGVSGRANQTEDGSRSTACCADNAKQVFARRNETKLTKCNQIVQGYKEKKKTKPKKKKEKKKKKKKHTR